MANDKPTVLFCGKTQHGDDLYRILVGSAKPNEYHVLKPHKGENQYPPVGGFVVHRCHEAVTAPYAHPPKKHMALRINDANGRTMEYEVCDKFMAAVNQRPKPVYVYMVDTSLNGPAKLIRGEVDRGVITYKDVRGVEAWAKIVSGSWHVTPQEAMDAYMKVLQQRFEMHSQSLREQVEAFHAEKQ